MLYNLASELDRARFAQRAKALMARGAPVELTEKVFKTPNQNRYAHLLIGLVAMEVGESIAFVKSYYFKRLCNPDIFVVEKEDKFAGKVEKLRSFTEISKEQMTTAIDRFIRWGTQQDWVMPAPGDESLLRELEIMIYQQQNNLGGLNNE